MWLAIAITIVASCACSIGKALQKEATRNLPRWSFDAKILHQYFQSRLWLTGLGADLGGGVLQVAGYALAPVSVLQPISGVGLVGLAVYSHIWLKEQLSAAEWVAVGVAGVGTLGLGATAGDGSGSEVSAMRMLTVLLLMVAGVAGVSLHRAQRQGRQHAGKQSARTGAAAYGLQAGACFGLSAASCRVGFLLGSRLQRLWVLLGLGGSVGLSSSGFVLQTCGFKEGSTVIVCTCAAVSSMVSGVLVGLLGLGEALPAGHGAMLVRITSWAGILLGVAVLANGAGGASELAAVLLSSLPPVAWKVLPVGAAVQLKSWASASRAEQQLPQVAAAAPDKSSSAGVTSRVGQPRHAN